MTASGTPQLAVVTVTHDSAHVLGDWLESLSAVDNADRMEVCVVDSGSSNDQLATMEAQARPWVSTFLQLGNVGFGRACNAGADATTGAIVLFTNPDTRLHSLPERAVNDEGLDGALVGAFARGPDRPLGFARLPRTREEAQKLALGAWSRTYERSDEDPAWVSGAALMIERDRFRRLGGFSPAFFMYFEDADLCARHRQAGGTIELDADFVVEHGHGESAGGDAAGSLDGPLDGVNRLSARRFATRYGARWHGAMLYVILVVAYVPRRVAVELTRNRRSPREALDYVICLLAPRRALRRLGAVQAREAIGR